MYKCISVIGQRLTLQDFVGDNINENPEHFVWIRIKSLISRLPAEQRYSKLAEWLDLYKSLEVNRLALKDYQKTK